jgi:thiol-disulfide isomerase/thioredoxin
MTLESCWTDRYYLFAYPKWASLGRAHPPVSTRVRRGRPIEIDTLWGPPLDSSLSAAPVAQLDRAQAYEAWGRMFESFRVRKILRRFNSGAQAARLFAVRILPLALLVGLAAACASATPPAATPTTSPAAVSTSPGFLGVLMSPAENGVRMQYVARGGPAALAGIVAQDIVTHVDDLAVTDSATLKDRIASFPAGQSVRLTVVRDGAPRVVPVTLGARPADDNVVAADHAGSAAPTLDGAVGLQGADVSTLIGKVTVVDFYATWCAPCHFTIPTLAAMHQRYAPQGFRVLGISSEESTRVLSFATQRNIPYDLAQDELGLVTRRYGVRSLPTLFVVDRKGVVRKVFSGVPDFAVLEQTVQALLLEAP